jgi:hypothetical protein
MPEGRSAGAAGRIREPTGQSRAGFKRGSPGGVHTAQCAARHRPRMSGLRSGALIAVTHDPRYVLRPSRRRTPGPSSWSGSMKTKPAFSRVRRTFEAA